jgi:DNA mismatch repair protein MutL
MGRVRVLPDVLVHKIAAGEIVERPASVVKELIENSLDAEARRIFVEADHGGKVRLTVRDDGSGMTGEDARTAFQHHATSKIASFDDLTAISTLGFRGEALPSIASVSRLRLRTVDRAEAAQALPGTEIEYEGGVLRAAREIAWPAGTEVSVEDLFYNVPARRKFLKADSTELNHLTRQVIYYALAFPQVEFQLVHQQRPLVEAGAAKDLEERVYQLFGEAFLANLVPVDSTREGVRINGLASLPHEQRPSANAQFLYVNRRMVRDRVLTHAVRLAYQDLIPPSAYPVAILFVEVDPREVDVNVHPCKFEIRFRDSNAVHSAIFHGIEEALLRRKSSLAGLARDIPARQLAGGAIWGPDTGFQRPAGFKPAASRTDLGWRSLSQLGLGRAATTSATVEAPLSPSPLAPPPSLSTAVEPHQEDAIPETAHLSPIPVVLGQFVESFIVAADRDGVMLIDQHVAHERVLFDWALKSMESAAGVPVQRLLLPVTLQLDPRRAAVVEEVLDQLNCNGFEVEWFGFNTLAVKGVPAVGHDYDAARVIEGLLDELDSKEFAGDRSSSAVRRLREKLAVSLACRAAIKINTALSREKMQWLVDALFQCRTPYTCPHGRPSVLRLSIEDVLRGFKRI